jgi:4a-hydroxytetrahydrobiopterin dehydratase
MNVPSGWVNDGQALEKRLDHHPDIALSWNRVAIRTWSHDVNAITERDAALAREIDALA